MGPREKLLGAKPLTEPVHIAALGETYLVRGMTGRERDAFEASCIEVRGKKRDFNLIGLRAKMVAFCTVDANGQRVFTDADAAELGESRADVIDRLFGVAQRLSGMANGDLDELGLSSATPTTSGSSSSPSPTT